MYESTQANKNQHESDSNQPEFDKSQHKSKTSQHELIRVRHKSKRINTSWTPVNTNKYH